MTAWQIIKSLFTFNPPAFIAQGGEPDQGAQKKPPPLSSFQSFSPFRQLNRSHALEAQTGAQKIWFDNVFRTWVSGLTFLICIGLSLSGTITTIKPIIALCVFYAASVFSASVFMAKNQYLRQIDYFLCFLDLFTISAGVFFTGGTASPLYFIYFIPLIVAAFHRDWALLLIKGFGSVFCYAAVLYVALDVVDVPNLFNLGARMFTMLLAVSAAIFAVRLLRRQDSLEHTRLTRMKVLTQVFQSFNSVTSLRDLPELVRNLVGTLNEEFAEQINGWSRIFLMEETHETMNAIMDPEHTRLELKQTLSTHACPAASSNVPFLLDDADKNPGCPTEKFSFKSHVCIPISGAGNETFGVIFSGSYKPEIYKAEEMEFLQFIGRALGVTLQRLRRVEELQLSLEMDSCAMATYMASSRGLPETYVALLDGIRTILKTEQASLMLWDANSSALKVKEVLGPYAEAELNLLFHMGEGLPGEVYESGKPKWTASVQNDPLLKHYNFPFKSLICLPLVSLKGKQIGVINAWHLDSGEGISIYEIDTASTFITRASVAIENALQHEKYKLPPEDIQKEDKAA